MRPPIVFLTIAFGVGLWAGLDHFVFPGRALPDVALSGGAFPIVALPVLLASILVARRAPLGAGGGIMDGEGMLWGGAAVRERDVTCTGIWEPETGSGRPETVGVAARLLDPVSGQGGVVDAE